MKEEKVTVCRLCMNLIEGGGFDLLDEVNRRMLMVVLPELNPIVTVYPVICKSCTENLRKSYDFKMEFLNFYNVNIKKSDIDNRINCTICCIDKGPLNNVEENVLLKEILGKYLPEIDITEETAVCEICLESLQNQYKFIQKCLDVEQMLSIYSAKNGDNGNVNLLTVLQTAGIKENENFDLHYHTSPVCVKKENTDILEMNSIDKIATECVNVKSESVQPDDIKIKSDKEEESQKENFDVYYHPELVCVKKENIDIFEMNSTNNIEIEHVEVKSEYIQQEDIEIKSDKEEESQATSVTKVYKCDLCDYQTKRKTDLTLRHVLRHKKPEELTMYNCTECPYQTKRRGDLSTHLAIHKDSMTVYKCYNCQYKTIYKSRLADHVQKHKLPQKYNCQFCSFTAPYKKTFVRHMKSHERQQKKRVYKCELCSYETKKRTDLTVKHMLIHRKPEELIMHKCDSCSFQAKHKTSLQRHMRRHLREVSVYNCLECDFKTNRKRDLTIHSGTHKYPNGKVKYKCDLCPYEATRQGFLRKHKARHENPIVFKCDLCSYETNAGFIFTRHFKRARHRNAMNNLVS